MFVTVRKRFRRGDEGWLEYINFIALPHLSEVRTIDSSLNRYVPHSGDIKCTFETLAESVGYMPDPDPDNEYFLFAIDLLNDPPVPALEGWKLLGHDLSDTTRTSSLLNCGPWEGELEPYTRRLNEFGLLSLADAELARKILPVEWGDHEHHAHVTIWALYEPCPMTRRQCVAEFAQENPKRR
jgi:hypothetical protein